jgi:glycosyltransferase involved in cell wall biosynthesis
MNEESMLVLPLVSVIIAAHNADFYIAETLDSIRAQTFRDFEVIVVDDGSTDRTAQIVAGYPEARCIRQPNRGQPVARNAGIAAAHGRYLAFVDADDLWLPAKLDKQVAYLSSHPEAAWIYSDALVFDSEKRTPICRIGETLKLHEGPVLEKLLLSSFIASPTPVVRRDVFKQTGLFDESPLLRFGEDWNMWLRIAEQYPVAVIREPLALIRLHGANMMSTTNPAAVFESKRRIAELAIARNPERLADLRARCISALAHSAGLRFLRLGRRSEARIMFKKAIRIRPSSLASYAGLATALLPPSLLTRLGAWRRRRIGAHTATAANPAMIRSGGELL